MPPMDKVMFAGGGHIDREIGTKLEVKNWAEDAEEKFRQHGWDGDSGCAGIGLLLSADNSAVEAALSS